MKRLFVALFTFSIGILVFNLIHSEKTYLVSDTIQIPVKTANKVTEINSFTVSDETKPEEIPKTFFNSFEYDKEKTDETMEYVVQSFSGWFIADDFKGMPEVWTILLVRDSEHPQTQKFTWSAMILTQLKDGSPNDDADFHSVLIKTQNNKLSFKTKKYHNVEYKFEGEFLRNGKTFAEEEKVLKGTLQKFVKGKKVAEFTADFAYFEPHCFH